MQLTTPNGTWDVVPTNITATVLLWLISLGLIGTALWAIFVLLDEHYGAGITNLLRSRKSGCSPHKRRLREAGALCVLAATSLAGFLWSGHVFGFIDFVAVQ